MHLATHERRVLQFLEAFGHQFRDPPAKLYVLECWAKKVRRVRRELE